MIHVGPRSVSGVDAIAREPALFDERYRSADVCGDFNGAGQRGAGGLFRACATGDQSRSDGCLALRIVAYRGNGLSLYALDIRFEESTVPK